MELYQYKAIDGKGKVSRGHFDALNAGDLEVRLSRLGLDLISFKEIKSKRHGISGRGVKRPDLITFNFHLEQLLRAGVPMLEALADLRDSVENPRLREVTTAMIESIGGGKNLSQAMADFPYVFTPVFVSLIRAGEESGELTRVLQNVTENLKWQDEQAAHAKKLFTYPAFVGVVVVAVMFFLMTYLVPQLLQFITMMGKELPMHTKILVVVSDIFVGYWYLILLVPALSLVGGFLVWQRNEKFRFQVDSYILRIPVFGPIYKKLILNRFASYFAIMYSSGIPVLDCVRAGESIVGNKAVRAALQDVGRQIADGSGISASFESTGLFPPLVLRMLRVGENTGALEQSLLNVSYFYTRDVRESIERLQAMIEPTMTVILGSLLLWIMLSVLGPIYDLISKIQI